MIWQRSAFMFRQAFVVTKVRAAGCQPSRRGGGALQRTAWLLTGDWALAEDLVQTALVRSWPRWERIRRRDDPEIYVRQVMVNTWASWSRRRWRGEMAEADADLTSMSPWRGRPIIEPPQFASLVDASRRARRRR